MRPAAAVPVDTASAPVLVRPADTVRAPPWRRAFAGLSPSVVVIIFGLLVVRSITTSVDPIVSAIGGGALVEVVLDQVMGLRGTSIMGAVMLVVIVAASNLAPQHARVRVAVLALAVVGGSGLGVAARMARRLPQELYKSLTWDRGAEMHGHKQFTMATDIQVYFCDPQSPWQRGSNENTNGLLRQYLPKGIDISGYSRLQLNAIARQLNQRPRKTLGFHTPAEMLSERVALTG